MVSRSRSWFVTGAPRPTPPFQVEYDVHDRETPLRGDVSLVFVRHGRRSSADDADEPKVAKGLKTVFLLPER